MISAATKQKTAALKKTDRSFSAKERSCSLFFQPRLTVGPTDDMYEREADAVADKVMGMHTVPPVQPKLAISSVRRMCAECAKEEEEEAAVQRKESGHSTNEAPSIVHDVVNSGGGNQMDNSTRSFMENRFGYDFSNIKIHTDGVAAKSAQSINALAYTSGNNIIFNRGQYAPETNSGKKLLAHELTHTIQQGEAAGVQRSCIDGDCATCEGGWKTLRVTAFFRRRATRAAMATLREKINVAKQILANCCVRLLFDFNWTLLPGGGTFNWGTTTPRVDYSDDAEQLGEGTTFSGARGIPMLVVDTVTDANGVTVSTPFDAAYTGSPYFAIPVAAGTKTRSIAHELGHVAGLLPHANPPNIMDAGTGTAVDTAYCNAIRAMAT